MVFIIDGFQFPGIPARKTSDPASSIVIENGRIKTANVFFDIGRRRAFFESESEEKSAVLFDLGENLTGGKIKTADCTDGTEKSEAKVENVAPTKSDESTKPESSPSEAFQPESEDN